MIKRKKQKIISGFGLRVRDGKEELHLGVDLRSWNFKIWKRQPIIFPERCVFLRRYRNRWGGGCAYKGLESGYIFKSIHITLNKDIVKNGVYEKGEIIGYSEKVPGIKEHEHFEVLKKDTTGFSKEFTIKHYEDFWIDPEIYMKKNNFRYN